MRTLGFVGWIAMLAASGCYSEYAQQSTLPAYQPEPVTVSGPPGGEMDPNTAYTPDPQAESPDQPGYPQGYPQGYPSGDTQGDPSGGETQEPIAADPGQAPAEPSADPQSPGYVMGNVTDGEIDQTLNPYGAWVVTEDGTRVWRPNTTAVGVNFTPYETCGSWVYSDYGWTWQACEDWSSWGWLAFHYGSWDWYDGGWCWYPDYVWSPGWVDWRYGNGYVGWRPSRPRYHGTVVRDHRNGNTDVVVRDHRGRSRDSDWRFAHESDLGKRNIRAHTFTNVAEGLRQTSDVARPPVRPTATVNAAQVMRGRLAGRVAAAQRGYQQPGRPSQPSRGYQPPPSRYQAYPQPGRGYQPPARTYQQPYQPQRGYQQPGRTYQPYQPPARGYQQPGRTYQPPARTYQPYQPQRGTYQPYQPQRGTYSPPSRSYTPPSRSTYSPPSRSTYSPPSRSSSYSAPSRSSSSSSPSRSSSSSSSSSSHSSSSSSHSSSSSSHSGGGRHR